MTDYILFAAIVIQLALIAVLDGGIALVSMWQFRSGPKL